MQSRTVKGVGIPQSQTGLKPGTVGQPIPSVVVKVIDPDTGKPLPFGQEGLLLVKGPNRMIGYLAQPEKTQEFLREDHQPNRRVSSCSTCHMARQSSSL